MNELGLYTHLVHPMRKINKKFHVYEKAPLNNKKALEANIIKFKTLALIIPRYGLYIKSLNLKIVVKIK